MSGFEFHGRNVADSRPVVHAPGVNREPYTNGLTDLQSAWSSMGYAKSMLRRAEHHLLDAEKPAMLLNGADKTSTHDNSVMVDRIPSYRITNSGCGTGAVVDNFGRTSYMKAKVANSRKVSRLEDKYVESHPVYEEPRRRSPLREPNQHHDHTDYIRTHRSKHTDHLVAGLPHSKYLDIGGEVTGVNYDSRPTKDYSGYVMSQRSNGCRHPDVDTTDPQAVRDTNIHFINDNVNNPYKSDRAWSVPVRLTHVGVHVPGPHPGGSVMSHYGVTSHQGIANGHVRVSDDVITSGGSMATNITYTVPSPDSGLGKKLRRNLKSSDRNTGGLAKLREKILLQRKKTLSPHENNSENVCNGRDMESMAMRRVHHHQDDPVTPSTKTVPHHPSRTVVPTRKIASAPPAPTYKGFSETEIRFKSPDGKVVRMEKKPRKIKIATKVHRHMEAKTEEKVNEKAPRIIAEKKTSRYERKDIITTRSWRVGQQLILRALGPAKVAKTGKTTPHSPPTHDRDDSIDHSGDESEEERSWRDVTGDNMTGPGLTKDGRQADESEDDEKNETGLSEEMLRKTEDDQKEAPLSKTAKSVLEDLFSDKSDTENQVEKKPVCKPYTTRTPVKRKRPQSYEREKEERNLPKVRHYDSDEVRKYIAKQRTERKKKQEEEEKVRQEAADNKRRQLEELYKKQKETARQPVTCVKPRTDDRQTDGSKPRKEGERDTAMWSDLSDLDSVNLHDVSTDIRHRSTTRDVEDAKTGAAPGGSDVKAVRSSHGNIDELIDHYATHATDASRDAGTKQLTASEILRQYTQQTGLSVEDVVSKYTHQMEALRCQVQGGYSRVTTQPTSAVQSSYPTQLYSPTAPSGNTGPATLRTRAQRIQAIKDAAAALKTRLNNEVQKMSHDMPVDPAREAEWVQPQPSDYGSRYDRMAGTASDYNVFTSDLPGVMSQAMEGHLDEAHQNKAATKIQAAYRGHSVRQDVRMESSHKSSTRRQLQALVDTQLSDDSISSGDSTLTSEPAFSSYPAVPFRQSTLDQPDFCAGRRSFAPPMAPASHKHPDSVPMKSNLTWNKDIPDPDPFSVINILARRQLHRVKAEKLRRERDEARVRGSTDHDGHSRVATDHSSHSAVATDRSEHPSHTDHRSRSAQEDRSVLRTHSRSARTLDDISMSYKDDFTALSASAPALSPEGASRSAASRSRAKPSLHSPDKTITSEADDTLEATLTPSDDSDDDHGAVVQKSSRRSAKTSAGMSGASSRSLVVSGRVMSHTADNSDMSELSSLGEEDLLADLHSTKAAGINHHGYVALQMSPAALEHRHAVELHLLDSMEVSMRQLTDVERTRAVTLAQQETVSLAQILKGRQQSHDHRLAEMQLCGRQEALEKERKLEAAQKRAEEAARSMATANRQAQDDVLNSLRGAASKLLQTQSEAAKVTADAAHQLTKAKLALVQPTSPWQPPNGHQVTAVAGGSQPTPLVEHGTQYSVRAASAASPDESYATSDGFESLSETSSPKPRTVQSDSEHRPVSATPASATPASDVSIPTASGATGSDTSEHTASTVQTDPDAVSPSVASPGSQSAATVTEEVPSAEKDHSVDLDTSNTEMESSMRELVPSVGQRKKLKKEGNGMDECSFSSADDFQLPSMSSTRRLSFEEDSFTKFTIDMMKQYMQEEEIRAQHQRSLLKLRERALKEKTRAELAWLEQQKQRHRDKGADEIYPQIKKRERALVLKLQQEKDKIKRMQEANRVASKERQLLLKQSQEIRKLRESTHKVFSHQTKVELWLRAVKAPGMCCPLSADCVSSTLQVCEKLETGKAKVPEDGATEDELSIHLDEDSESSPNKDYKSDSELYASSSEKGRGSSPTDPRVMQKLKKLKLDEKYLTKREQILCRRRKNAEKLMKWKQRLDEEEATVERLEKEVLVRLDTAAKADTIPGKSKSVKAKTAHTESIATETAVSTAADFSMSPWQVKGSLSAHTITEEVTTATSIRSAIRSSVPDEISSHISSASRRTHESGKDSVESSVAEEYANETFESSQTEQVASESATATTVQSASRKTPSPVSSPVHSRLSKLAREKGICLPSPRSPILTAVSVSESEDSPPLTQSETPSDQSDVAKRIQALSDDLQRRKREAERLKKEQKKQEREKLKEQEKTLKKEIEVYDTYIARLTSKPEVETSGGSTVKPQIKEQRLRHGGIIRSESTKSSEGHDDTESPRLKDTPSHALSSKSSDTIIHQVSVTHDVSMDGSGDSSSPSKKALTTEQRSSTTVPPSALTPSGDKSESSEIQEEICQVPTEVTSQSELHLKLHDVTNDDVSDGGIRSEHVTPRSDDYTTPRSDSKIAPISARSLSEIAEEYSMSIHTELPSSKNEVSDQISAPVKSTAKPSVEIKSVAPSVATSLAEAKEEGKDEGTAHSDSVSSRTLMEESRSERSEESRSERSEKSGSERSERSERSEKSEPSTYSKDFYETTESGRSSRTEEASKDDDSIETDISEDLSVEPDSGESSPRVFDLTVPQKEPEVVDEGVLTHLEVGRRVLVGGVKSGVLQFKGKVQFAPGMWAGVELDEAEGTNDGTKDGVAYFSCRALHGLFVPPDKITDHPSQTVSVHDDVVINSSKASLPEEENVAKSSPRDAHSPSIDLQTPPIELVDDEQTVDDVSIATTDSELERVINNAEAAVMTFEPDMSAEAELERVLTQEAEADAKLVCEKEEKLRVVPDTDSIAHNLLTEAISEILNIRKQKREQLTQGVTTVSVQDDSPLLSASEVADSNQLISPFVRPSTPLGHATPDSVVNQQDALDQLYEDIGSLTGEDDGWMDDDFGLSVKPHKPPPTYPLDDNQQQPGVLSRQDLRLDLHKLTQDVFYAVPHSIGEVTKFTQRSIDIFWQKRRCGEPWTDVSPPDSYYGAETDASVDVDTRSSRVYKKLVFDLTGEILCEMYVDEEEAPSTGMRAKSQQRRYFKEKYPPRTVEVLKPIVEEHVADYLGLGEGARPWSQTSKWGGRKKKDHVDQLLVQELRAEEPDWLDYDDDELAVKIQIADMIFESLLSETAGVISGVLSRKLTSEES